MKKKLLSLLLAVAMALSLLPAGVVTVRADEPVKTLSALQNDLPLGDIILDCNYTADSTRDQGLDNGITVSTTVTLDLNGHTIRPMGRLFKVNDTLTMQDSSAGKTGTITGGNAYGDGGCVSVNGGAFTLAGGSITGNKATEGNGGGVSVSSGCSFTMTDGFITGNTAENDGGGVYVSSGASFTMTGGSITGNTAERNGDGVFVDDGGSFSLSGAPAIGGEVYLGGSSVITVTGALTNTDPIPVTMEIPGVFAKADSSYNGGRLTESDIAKFNSSDSGYTVILNGKGEAELVVDPPPVTWADLQAALMHNSNVKLAADIAAGSGNNSLEVPQGVTVTLDLNGKTINGTALSDPVLDVSGTLTLKDSSQAGGGTVSCRQSGTAVKVYNSGTFNLSGAPNFGGDVWLAEGKVITVTDALTNTVPIPVTMGNSGVFAKAASSYKGGRLTESDIAKFTSSDSGYAVSLNDDGEAVLVAEVSTWADLQTALNAGGYVRLVESVPAQSDSTPQTLQVPKNVTVTLDLFGCAIDGTALGSEVLDVSGSLSLTDSSENGNVIGKIDTVKVSSGGSFTMTGGTVTAEGENNTGVHLMESTFNLSGSAMVNGSVSLDSGTFNLSGAPTINGDSRGYGVTVLSGTFNLSGAPKIEKPVWLHGSSVITVTGALDNTNPIPVKMVTAGVFAQAADGYNGGRLTASDAEKFTSGDNTYFVALNSSGKAELTTEWRTLQAALNAGGTVTLDKDYKATPSVETYLTIPSGVDVTLDLNGHTIDRGLGIGRYPAVDAGSVIRVEGTLTVQDKSDAKTGSITGGAPTANGGGVYVSGGSFTMEGGSITGNTAADDGGGVYVSGGSFTLAGGSITGNEAKTSGGGVYVADGSFTLAGGSITGNEAKTSGGGVFVADGKTLTLSGGSVSGNTVSGDPDNLALDYAVDGTDVSKGAVSVTAAPAAPIGVRYVPHSDGVTIPDSVVFTTGALPEGVTPEDCFTSEMIGYQMFTDSVGKAMLARPATVTWKNDNNGIIGTETVACGTVPAHDAPVKENTAQYTYAFTGWNDGTTTYAPGTALPAVTGDVTYRATFTETTNRYTVTWKNDDGSVINTTSVEYGQKPTHEDATKAATAAYTYNFAGWKDGTETYSPGEALPAVTGNVTYTAVFTEMANEFPITYVLNDNAANPAVNPSESWTVTAKVDSAEIDTLEFSSDGRTWTEMTFDEDQNAYSLTLAEAPSTLNFSASGSVCVYYEETGEEVVPSNYSHDGSLAPGQGDVELQPDCAEASPATLYYTCAHNPGNPAGYTVESDEITLVAPTRTGYTFTGWTWEGQTEPVTEVTIPKGSTGNKSYTANWEKAVYTLTWEDVSGHAWKTEQVAYGAAITAPTENPTRTGYSFKGWSDCPETMPDRNVTVRAQWEIITYSITCDPAGGTMDSAGYTVTATVTEPTGLYGAELNSITWGNTDMSWDSDGNPAVVLPAAPTSDVLIQAVFCVLIGDGWYDYYLFSGTVPADMFLTGGTVTLTNVRNSDDTAQLTFAASPGGWTNPTSYTVESSDITLVAPTRTGYTFTGWTWEGQTGPVKKVTIPKGSTGNKSYTANWAVKEYTVTDWAGLKAALAEGGNVTVGRNLTAADGDAVLEVPEGVTAVLDLKGHTIDGSALEDSSALKVSGNLTITDSGADKTGNLTRDGGNDDEDGVGVVDVKPGGSLTLNGGKIAGSGVTQIVNVYGLVDGKWGTFTMTGGTVYGSELVYSAVFVNGDFTMSGGAVTGGGRYGGVYAWTDSFTISGKPVIEEGVYLDEDTVLTIGGELDRDTRLTVRTAVTPIPGSPVVITGGLAGKGSDDSFLSAKGFDLGTTEAGEAQLINDRYEIERSVKGAGTLELSPQRAKAGETVTVTPINVLDSSLETLTAKYWGSDGGDPETVTLTQSTTNPAEYTFTMPAGDVTVSAVFTTPPVPYLDADGAAQTCQDYTLITNASFDEEGELEIYSSGWYVVADKVKGGHINAAECDEFNLILCDNASLTLTDDYYSHGALTVYAQSAGGDVGELKVTGTDSDGAIHARGGVTINGGRITAIGTGDASGVCCDNQAGITLNWTGPNDSVQISSVSYASVKLAKDFTDGTSIYKAGTYDAEQFNAAMAGKTLTPPSYAVSIDSGIKNGAVKADPASTVEGQTVTLTVTPDTGYEPVPDSLTAVWGENSTALTLSFDQDEGAWSFTMPAGDVTVSAAFKPKTYTVTWLKDDGTELEKTTVQHGVVPTHDGPEKTADAQYTYTFKAWDPAPVAASGPATYQATYTGTKNSYQITWQDDAGKTIDTTTVEYGKTPTHADASKDATAEYTYTFAGWDPAPEAVTGAATYQAKFTGTKNRYQITWQDDAGKTIDTTTVEYGKTPTHADATKAATAEYSYMFSGWDPAPVAVTGAATYKAKFTATPIQQPEPDKFTVTWKNWNGDVLKTDANVEAGTMPSYTGDTPTRAEDADNTYTFQKWTPDVAKVTGDAVYTAVFTATAKPAPEPDKYTVTWKNWNGDVLKTDANVEAGTMPSYSGDTPTKAEDADNTYTFQKWTPDVAKVTGDVTYTAVFTATAKPTPVTVTYTVAFNSDGGTTVEPQTVESGKTAVKPADPTRDGYTFAGWQLDGEDYEFSTPVTASITLKAAWTKNEEPAPSTEVDASQAGQYAPEEVRGLVEAAEALDAQPGETIRLTVKAAEPEPEVREAIETEAGAEGKELVFLDLSLTRVTENGESEELHETNGRLITITIPFDTAGKDIVVYRFHDGEAQAMKKDPDTSKGEEGYVVRNDCIVIYASQFSAYAIGYTEKAEPGITGSVSGSTLTYSVSNAPEGARLIAARYDGGQMTWSQVLPLSEKQTSLGGSGDTVRLFLLDGATSRPLCPAWSSR